MSGFKFFNNLWKLTALCINQPNKPSNQKLTLNSMKKLTALILCACCTLMCIAQRSTIKGSVADTTDATAHLSNTSILLLRAKDSTLYKFTRSNSKGAFQLQNLDTGKYVLLVTYPGYADYVDQVQVTSDKAIDLGAIHVISKAHLLQEVVVRQTVGAIKVKGDTTEFTADSFHVKENANVEDLLKKMPGIQVDSKGQITAQGEKVKKVLVDGEEFFGDDPTLVTQNLRADMVDKVQVYDKKSDQAAFTNVDDGQKDKTINIKLKEDKKRGYFGKIAAGAGVDGHHDNQLMFNKFRKKEKIAGYALASNTGTSGLGWRDQDSYGASNNESEYDEASGITYFSGSSDPLDSWNGQYNGQGLPLVQSGGLHYNNKWDGDKQSINGNYKLSKLMVDNLETSNAKNILPGNINYNNSRTGSANSMLRNKGNGVYEVDLDSSQSLKITVDASATHKINFSDSYTETLREDSTELNNSKRTIRDTANTNQFNSTLLWRKKFHKKGRTLSFNLKENYTDNNSRGFLYALNNFYTDPSAPTTTTTDQYKTSSGKNTVLNGKLTYSEPLSAYSAIIANYGLTVNNSISSQLSYNRNGNGKYDALDSVYSNDYKFNVLTNRGGLAYSYNRKKIRSSIGSDVGFTDFKQTDQLFNNYAMERHFVNWYPQARFNYSFTNQRRLGFSYNGNTQQPSIQQIQPVRSNNNPLYIVVGNPLLKPSFNNNYSLNFFDYKVLTSRSIWFSASYNTTHNAITSNTYTDSSGKTTTQSVNVNGNTNFNGYLDYSFKLKKLNMFVSFGSNVNTSRYVSIVNNVNNITNSGNYSGNLRLGKEKENKYEFSLNGNATYSTSTSTIQKDAATRYWTYSIEQNSEVTLPLKFTIHSDINYSIYQKTATFTGNNNVFLWNAWFGKKFGKKDNLLVKVSGNDLLNKNVGIRRQITSNLVSENRYNTIRRFFLLSVVWNFNKNGGK